MGNVEETNLGCSVREPRKGGEGLCGKTRGGLVMEYSYPDPFRLLSCRVEKRVSQIAFSSDKWRGAEEGEGEKAGLVLCWGANGASRGDSPDHASPIGVANTNIHHLYLPSKMRPQDKKTGMNYSDDGISDHSLCDVLVADTRRVYKQTPTVVFARAALPGKRRANWSWP